MTAFQFTGFLTAMNYVDFLLRLIFSMVCGGLIGFEREKRLKNAGLRTHIIVALASCLMMIISKYAFFDIVTLEGVRLQADGSRIASAVVQAIGFIGAGVIFIRKENVVGLTTAAGLWATVGIGLSIGAGLWVIGAVGTFFILGIQWVFHSFHSRSHAQNQGSFRTNITKHGVTIELLYQYFNSIDVHIQDLQLTRNEAGEVIVSGNIVFKPTATLSEMLGEIDESKIIDSISIYPVI